MRFRLVGGCTGESERPTLSDFCIWLYTAPAEGDVLSVEFRLARGELFTCACCWCGERAWGDCEERPCFGRLPGRTFGGDGLEPGGLSLHRPSSILPRYAGLSRSEVPAMLWRGVLFTIVFGLTLTLRSLSGSTEYLPVGCSTCRFELTICLDGESCRSSACISSGAHDVARWRCCESRPDEAGRFEREEGRWRGTGGGPRGVPE